VAHATPTPYGYGGPHVRKVVRHGLAGRMAFGLSSSAVSRRQARLLSWVGDVNAEVASVQRPRRRARPGGLRPRFIPASVRRSQQIVEIRVGVDCRLVEIHRARPLGTLSPRVARS